MSNVTPCANMHHSNGVGVSLYIKKEIMRTQFNWFSNFVKLNKTNIFIIAMNLIELVNEPKKSVQTYMYKHVLNQKKRCFD